MKGSMIFIVVAALLAGCGNQDSQVSLPLNDTSSDVFVEEIQGHTYFFDMTNPSNTLVAAGGVLVEKVEDGITLNGGDPLAKVGGKISAARLIISSQDEAFLSGKPITINVVAKSATADSLKVAYSTREVGNSGWHDLKLEPQYRLLTFGYSIPRMRKGKNDFVGFLPVGGDVQIRAVSINTQNPER